jgi:hypothetical protein
LGLGFVAPARRLGMEPAPPDDAKPPLGLEMSDG